MKLELSPSAKKVQEALTAFGLSLQVIELPASTRTAVEASLAVGCQVGQIVKSLIFRTKKSGRPILVLVSGANRVNEPSLEMHLGEPLGKADAEFVRQQTGYVIGGVPPVGFNQPIETYIDQDLMAFPSVWAAAGTPNAVFQLNPEDLPAMTGGKVVRIH